MYTHWSVYFWRMTQPETSTRQRIVEAANRLFYREGIRAVSVDAVAEEAGITKRSLYYHFKSKDDLVAAYLDHRDQPNLDAYSRWFTEADGDVADRIAAIFEKLAERAERPGWKGCGFLRTAAELAAMPGHPAVKAGARHKTNFEKWLAGALSDHNVGEAKMLAREIVLLMDGAFSSMLIHHNPDYVNAAGHAAATLIRARMAGKNAA